ncbi:Protein of unknown function [Gryllus bimaculatus]|nr:Protein of unknown function [Gryllus bimaculatus]
MYDSCTKHRPVTLKACAGGGHPGQWGSAGRPKPRSHCDSSPKPCPTASALPALTPGESRSFTAANVG